MQHHKVLFHQPFELETGGILPELEIAYCTSGALNENKDNVVWVCHALTANADAEDWWSGLVGSGKLFNPETHFIICANILGSPYGTTSPVSNNPQTQQPYENDFPHITPRDMAKAHSLLAKHLGIEKIYVLIGGSLGGQQAMEWAIAEPSIAEHLVLLATNARHSPWGIAFNETQRMALELGEKGLDVARAIAMLSYRSYAMYQRAQQDENHVADNFKAASYQRYQGEKLRKRFNADCYRVLSKAMDAHNVGRGKESAEIALAGISAKTLVIGVSSDNLFPISEQQFLAAHIVGAQLAIIDSPYGHDGFLTETVVIENELEKFLP